MGLNGEGPVILSPESRRRIRLPLIGGDVMDVLAAVLLIWLGPRTPAEIDEKDWVFPLALCLTFAGAGWPMFVVRSCVERDRAAGRGQPPMGAPMPPPGEG